MKAYSKGTKEEVQRLLDQVRLTKARDWLYALDDEFHMTFDAIASDTSFYLRWFQGVATFNVIVDEAKVIEDELLPWFKSRDFKCVSITDNSDSYSYEKSPTMEYTLELRRKPTDEERDISAACCGGTRWDEGKPWTVILRVGFSGEGCKWVDVPTGEVEIIPAEPERVVAARPAKTIVKTRKELHCS